MRPAFALFLAGLALATGCKSYHSVVPHDTAIQLVDEGTVKTLRPVDIDYSPPFSSRHVRDTYLIPDQVRKFDKDNADWAVSFTPPWLRSAAWETARQISANEPTDQARWLLSANPTVVGIGPKPSDSSGGGVRPVTLNDMDVIVTRLLVLDPWQAPLANVRTVNLPQPMALREVLRQTPWK